MKSGAFGELLLRGERQGEGETVPRRRETAAKTLAAANPAGIGTPHALSRQHERHRQRRAFNNPGGIAVGPGGKLYVADTLNHTIRTQCECDPAAINIALYAGLTIQGSIGCQYRIDYTTFLNSNPNLTVRTPLTTVTLTSSPYLFVDTTAVSGTRFYRAVALP